MGTTLCMGINSGGEDEWNSLWNRYLESKVSAQREYILSALGCSNEVWILARFVF